MTEGCNILLVAEASKARRLMALAPVGPDGKVVQACSDGFAALEALAGRAYRSVLVTAPQPEMGDLVKAIRRVRPGVRVFGVCSPAAEWQLRRDWKAGGETFDDYFIFPPSPAEWARMLESAGGAGEGDASGAVKSLSTPDLTALIESATSLDELAACTKQLVKAACGIEPRWSRRGEPRQGAQQLLTLQDDPPRILFSGEPLAPDAGRDEYLAALRAILSSLTAAAKRAQGLRRLAITDYLTGAYNRRYFDFYARKILDVARARRTRVTLLLYDIDDFKAYNDEFGHAAGDEILRDTARLMRETTRKSDVVARYGGDEFAVLFCDLGEARQAGSKPPETAYALSDRFRKAVHSYTFKMLGPKATGSLTISGGLASFPWDGLKLEELTRAADLALSKAKADGKNNIQIVGGGPDGTLERP